MNEPKDDPIEKLLQSVSNKNLLSHDSWRECSSDIAECASRAAPAIRALQERVKELEGKQFIFDDQGNSRECNLMNDSEIRVKFMDLIRENNQLNAKLAWFEDNKVPKEPLEAKLARVIEIGDGMARSLTTEYGSNLTCVANWRKAVSE